PDRRSEAGAAQPAGECQAFDEDGELGLPPPAEELPAVGAVARLGRRREVPVDEPREDGEPVATVRTSATANGSRMTAIRSKRPRPTRWSYRRSACNLENLDSGCGVRPAL